jgi:hypothetical protein
MYCHCSSCLLRWGLANFLWPGLASNYDLPNLYQPSSWSDTRPDSYELF